MKKNILVTIIAIFIVSSVFLTVESVTSSAEIASLEQKELGLLKQKQELDENLVKTVSVSDLAEKGHGLGFNKPSELIYLGENANVANLQ